jgi:hypothetical protein
MGEWEYLFVTLKQYKPGGQTFIHTVNGAPLPNRYMPALEYFNERGQERWEMMGLFDLLPEHRHPTFVFKRQVHVDEAEAQSHAASVAVVPSLFGDLQAFLGGLASNTPRP